MPDIDRAISFLWDAAYIWEDDPASEEVYNNIIKAITILEDTYEETDEEQQPEPITPEDEPIA